MGDIRNLKNKCYLYKLSLTSTSIHILYKKIYWNWETDFRETFNPFLSKYLTCETGIPVPGISSCALGIKQPTSKASLLYSWWPLCAHHQGCLVCEMPLDNHLGWVSSPASCRDAVGCLGNFLSGWYNCGALGLIFNNKANIISKWAEEGKLPILPDSGGGRGLSCLSENRLSSAAPLSHWHGPLAGLIGRWQ